MKDLQEAYKLLQEHCGIKAGDSAKVLRAFKSDELGCYADCSEVKIKFIGKTFEVVSVFDRFIRLRTKTHGVSTDFPFFVLEKVEDALIHGVTMAEVNKEFGHEVTIIEGCGDC